MILDLLAQILDDAVEYELLDANPARGKRRRLKVPKPARSFLEPDMVVDLLDVAEALGAQPAAAPALRAARVPRHAVPRRPADLRADADAGRRGSTSMRARSAGLKTEAGSTGTSS